MPIKKKTTKVDTNVQIDSNAKNIVSGIKFEKLPQGHCFVYNNKFYMKPKDTDNMQLAICLTDGSLEQGMCGEIIVPCAAYMDFESLSS